MIKAESVRPRGRPKSDHKRREILRAAGECFLELGLSAASMDGVARQAGVSKQTVYSHFPSKDELFQSVIQDKCERYRIAPERLAFDAGLKPGLLEFTRSYLALILDPQVVAMIRQIAAQSAAGPEMSELFYAAGPGPTIQRIAQFLAAHRETGELDLDDSQERAADYVHETGARFKFELMMRLRERVSERERLAHAEHRVRQFLAAYATARATDR